MYINFSTAISSVFTPKINRIVAENKNDVNQKLTDLMIKVGRLQFFVVMLILTGFIFFGKYFISIWVGSEYLDAYYVALLLICPVTLSLIQNIGIEIRRAKNMHKIVSLFMFATAILNVGVSIWFAKLWGVIGVALGTTISLVVNIMVIDIYYQTKIKLNIGKFYKNIIFALPSFLIPSICGIIMMVYWKPTSIYLFVLQICIYAIIYCVSVFMIGLNKDEKLKIKTTVNKILIRKKDKNDNNI